MPKPFEKGHQIGKQFEVGHASINEAVRITDKRIQGNILKSRCLEFLTSVENGVESGKQAGAFSILQSVASGYKGVKPADRLKSIELMLRICGMLTDKVEIENSNPFQSLDNRALVSMAEGLILAIKSCQTVKGRNTLEN